MFSVNLTEGEHKMHLCLYNKQADHDDSEETMYMYKHNMLLGLYNKQADQAGWKDIVHVRTQDAFRSI